MSAIVSRKTGAPSSAAIREAARHVDQLGVRRARRASTVRGSSAMPQIGQAPGASRTISGCIGQVYSTRVARQGREVRLERHAAFRARAWMLLPDLGIHRAHVGRALHARGGDLRLRRQKLFRSRFEAIETARMAEVVARAVVVPGARCVCRIDRHAANRIDDFSWLIHGGVCARGAARPRALYARTTTAAVRVQAGIRLGIAVNILRVAYRRATGSVH